MEYQFIKGQRRTANLVWSPEEKILYSRQCIRNGKVEYMCYQKLLHDKYRLKEIRRKIVKNKKMMKRKAQKVVERIDRIRQGRGQGQGQRQGQGERSEQNEKNKSSKKRVKNGEEKKEIICTARLYYGINGTFVRNKVEHTSHDNHEFLRNEIVTKNNIIDRCTEFQKVAEGLPIRVPANDIFTLEVSK